MWSALFRPGLVLLDGHVLDVRLLGQELAHFAAHHRPGVVLWCDGDHGFNPYDFAELNLTRGFSAEDGADRVLVKRCLTPFQWDTVLTQHLDEKLAENETTAVLALPYDRLFSTDELAPWEQEDCVRYSLDHLRLLSREHGLPILLGIDMDRWRRKHSGLADLTTDAFDHRWKLRRYDDRLRAIIDVMPATTPYLPRQSRLPDYAEELLVSR